MLLIRELARLGRDVLAVAWHTRRLGLLVAVVGVVVIAALAATVTTAVPVVIYPFL